MIATKGDEEKLDAGLREMSKTIIRREVEKELINKKGRDEFK